MSNELTKVQASANAIEQIVVDGNLESLNSDQRIQYYRSMCKTFNLDPLTKPFEYIELNKKLVLYVTKNACDQLRRTHNISITKLVKYTEGDTYFVEAHAQDNTGRVDVSTAGILLVTEEKYYYDRVTKERKVSQRGGDPLSGTDLINAKLKCETKAKRRVTLSMGGLGLPDDDDVEKMAMEAMDITNTGDKAQLIIDDAKEATKAIYKVDDDFMTAQEVELKIADIIEKINSLPGLEAYLEWKQSNKAGLTQFAADNKSVWLNFHDMVQTKQAELQIV